MALEAGELTEAMLRALGTEWQRAKGATLPAAGLEDRRLLFAAVARGLLEYLDTKQNEAIKTIELERAGTSLQHQVVSLDLDITVP